MANAKRFSKTGPQVVTSFSVQAKEQRLLLFNVSNWTASFVCFVAEEERTDIPSALFR